MDHDDWLQHRTTGIGGSDAGGILNLNSKYSSPLAVWMDKTGRSIPDDLSGNEAIWFGNTMEAIIRREFVAPYILEKMGIEVEVIDPTHMYRSIENPFMSINTDGFLRIEYMNYNKEAGMSEPQEKLVGLEIKTGNSYVLSQWGGVNGDEIPDSYYAQDQHYMAGTGLDEWWTFGLIGNQRLLRIVPRNETFIADMIKKEKAFWELVQLNDPLYAPMPTGSDADMKALFQLGEQQQDTTVFLSDIQQPINQYEYANARIKELETYKEQQKQEIIMAMGTSKYGETNNYKVTFSRFNRSNFNMSKFMQDHPGILDDYITESETGRLSVKGI
jgi:putative phage-type endonuclease